MTHLDTWWKCHFLYVERADSSLQNLPFENRILTDCFNLWPTITKKYQWYLSFESFSISGFAKWTIMEPWNYTSMKMRLGIKIEAGSFLSWQSKWVCVCYILPFSILLRESQTSDVPLRLFPEGSTLLLWTFTNVYPVSACNLQWTLFERMKLHFLWKRNIKLGGWQHQHREERVHNSENHFLWRLW